MQVKYLLHNLDQSYSVLQKTLKTVRQSQNGLTKQELRQLRDRFQRVDQTSAELFFVLENKIKTDDY